jgi:hypothetical protein
MPLRWFQLQKTSKNIEFLTQKKLFLSSPHVELEFFSESAVMVAVMVWSEILGLLGHNK